MATKKIIIANWKMYLNLQETLATANEFAKKFKDFSGSEAVICCAAPALAKVGEIIGKTPLKLGAQNVFWQDKGTYTGEISPTMLVELGCEYVIIGHSERRRYLSENYEMVHKKVKAVVNTEKLTPIICIGESWEEKKTDQRDFVLVDQLQQALSGVDVLGNQQIIIAYEPIWAISSGQGAGTAIEPTEAEYAHKIIKLTLNDMFGVEVVSNNFRIIYGGSIDSKSVKGFANLENIDGLLVGGASLKADEFFKIASSL
ncbi:triose-phosphate isomerase [Patescibacteria group bacterium]|nr:triose-phosphate isomerase [Patescibacteria group bacterium]MBU0879393.1 triose-phosphate isomerase [Patescibacteria group bacterium]MBU0880075.1 triose-phosphate isomerase [Patescibacteria group bacterium]MBU1062745.1 triose-phosphate isomerase [Patescibacteria group bacterium]MBU1783008.1 triose-phosphate isomerase [Patescibacteria group bacterium]